jgi:hypothetical protein
MASGGRFWAQDIVPLRLNYELRITKDELNFGIENYEKSLT